MSKSIIFSSKNSQISKEECANILKDISDKILNGEIDLESGGNQLKLSFPGEVDFDLSVKEKDKKGYLKKQIDLEISWKIGGEDPLKIG